MLEGEVEFTVAEETITAATGTVILVSSKPPHAARSTKPGKMLTIFDPCGLEGAMAAFRNLSPEQANDPAIIQAISEQYDIIDLSQPPIPTLIRFYSLLLAGDADALLSLYQGEPLINTPLDGEIKGEAAWRNFVKGQQEWLSRRDAKATFSDIIISAQSIVLEFVLNLHHNGEQIELPVALAADRQDDKITAIRLYHSTWPLTGEHVLRSPLLQVPAVKLSEPAIVEAYMVALEEPNLELLLSLFNDAGYVREPSGAKFRHSGPEGRRDFYNLVVGSGFGGGVVLHHCSATTDYHAFAVEYICDEWGKVAIAPQAGLAVYEYEPSGKLVAVRIYDDITPPEAVK